MSVGLQPFEIDSSGMPLRLGSALRVPSYAYSMWGIPEGGFREESDRQYELEWKAGSPQQMQYVVDSVNRSGMGNYAHMLRDANARVVSRLLRDLTGRVNYLETGAGVSTVVMVDQLLQDGHDLERIYATLVEPSESRVENTATELEKRGLKRSEHFRVIVGRDLDVPRHVEPGSQDIVCSVATIHHHAYLDRPMRILADVTRANGIIVLPDWHNSMWEHPNRVYEFLRNELEWPTKEADLNRFVEAYHKALEKAPQLNGRREEANVMIRRFWKGWTEVRGDAVRNGTFNPNDDILMLEAHRPLIKYINELKSGRFEIDTPTIRGLMAANPWYALPTSSLLAVTVGQKID